MAMSSLTAGARVLEDRPSGGDQRPGLTEEVPGPDGDGVGEHGGQLTAEVTPDDEVVDAELGEDRALPGQHGRPLRRLVADLAPPHQRGDHRGPRERQQPADLEGSRERDVLAPVGDHDAHLVGGVRERQATLRRVGGGVGDEAGRGTRSARRRPAACGGPARRGRSRPTRTADARPPPRRGLGSSGAQQP